MSTHTAPRRLLLACFEHALQTVAGRPAVVKALRARPIDSDVTLIAAGKAAQSMSEGAWDVLGKRIRGGLVISKAGHLDIQRLKHLGLEALIGGHPVPSPGSMEAGQRLRKILEAKTEPTLLFLLSGGASSLVESPVAGVGLAELVRLNEWLLGSGLPIDAMNLVRKSVSRIKGGGLLGQVGERRLRVLAISDVPGDLPSIIGSGLLVPEPELASRVAALSLPGWLRDWIEQGLRERADLPGCSPEVELVATLGMAKEAAAAAARKQGLQVQIHGRFLEGDAAERGRELALRLKGDPPGMHIWGGETTVRLPATPGRGGRNQHLALAAALELAGRDDCLLLSAGTDGTDGPTADAGALVDAGTLERARLQGVDADSALAAADAGSLLAASGDLVHTGPTGTNVMDLVLGLRL